MCVTLTIDVSIVSSKITNLYLNFGKNLQYCSNLRVILDLTAPAILGVNSLTKYNPLID